MIDESSGFATAAGIDTPAIIQVADTDFPTAGHAPTGFSRANLLTNKFAKAFARRQENQGKTSLPVNGRSSDTDPAFGLRWFELW